VLLLLNRDLYKWRTTSRVWYLDFHHDGGIYRVNGTSTDLERSVWHQVVVGWLSHIGLSVELWDLTWVNTSGKVLEGYWVPGGTGGPQAGPHIVPVGPQ
jgi:hypothetical protein